MFKSRALMYSTGQRACMLTEVSAAQQVSEMAPEAQPTPLYEASKAASPSIRRAWPLDLASTPTPPGARLCAPAALIAAAKAQQKWVRSAPAHGAKHSLHETLAPGPGVFLHVSMVRGPVALPSAVLMWPSAPQEAVQRCTWCVGVPKPWCSDQGV